MVMGRENICESVGAHACGSVQYLAHGNEQDIKISSHGISSILQSNCAADCHI